MPFIPRTVVYSTTASCPVSVSTAVLSAASITPPVTPKITAAPVPIPSGTSNFAFGFMASSWISASFSIFASSFVVITISTSGTPAPHSSSLVISNFFAVHGITDTITIFSFAICS